MQSIREYRKSNEAVYQCIGSPSCSLSVDVEHVFVFSVGLLPLMRAVSCLSWATPQASERTRIFNSEMSSSEECQSSRAALNTCIFPIIQDKQLLVVPSWSTTQNVIDLTKPSSNPKLAWLPLTIGVKR